MDDKSGLLSGFSTLPCRKRLVFVVGSAFFDILDAFTLNRLAINEGDGVLLELID